MLTQLSNEKKFQFLLYLNSAALHPTFLIKIFCLCLLSTFFREIVNIAATAFPYLW